MSALALRRFARRTACGFTLVELMVTVTVIGILAAIALPIYQSYVARSRRAEAAALLVEAAQFLERNFTETNTYDQSFGTSGLVALTLPITQSPRTGTAVYTISTAALGSSSATTTFLLTATPVTNGPMSADACGALTLNHLGQKGVGTGADVNTCWR